MKKKLNRLRLKGSPHNKKYVTRDRIISYWFHCRLFFSWLLVKRALLYLTWKDSPIALLPSKMCLPKNKVKFTALTQLTCGSKKEKGGERFNILPHLQWTDSQIVWCGDWKTISYKRFRCIRFLISWLMKFKRNWLSVLFVLPSISAAAAAASTK